MKNFLLTIILIVSTRFLHSQSLHVGILGGISSYAGDLSENLFSKNNTNAAVGLSANYEFNNHIMLRGGITFLKVGGADRYSHKPNNRERNLSFETAISELSAMGEYYLLDLSKWQYSPYVYAGAAVFHFNPYTYDERNHIVYLHPLSTEGQGINGRKHYALTQLAIPIGAGLKFNITEDLRIGLETGLRKLFTGYLDDVSKSYIDKNALLAAKGQLAVDISYRADEVGGSPQYPPEGFSRGNPDVKDYYYFAGVHLTYRLVSKVRWGTH